MRTIWKYVLELTEVRQTYEIPAGSVVRHVGQDTQSRNPTIWVEVPDTTAITMSRGFLIRGTGHDVPRDCDYVGSMYDAPFIWHIFEIKL